MHRIKYAAANWKMNLTFSQASALLDSILLHTNLTDPHKAVIFAVPYPYLVLAKEKTKHKKNIFIAAQNVFHEKAGAYTGEVSAEMLHSVGTDFVLVGHSERRSLFAESTQDLAQKINLSLECGIKVIFCCGEPLAVREAGHEKSFVEKQLAESLYHLPVNQIRQLIIAYEPIWAIGTGKTASVAQAEDIQSFIRNTLAKQFGKETAQEISILYGGSVNATNAQALFQAPNIDGGLVGGASLVASTFLDIIKAL